MQILGIVVRVAIVVTLLGHASSHASTRARSLAETVLGDASVRLAVGGFHACLVNDRGQQSRRGRWYTRAGPAPLPRSSVPPSTEMPSAGANPSAKGTRAADRAILASGSDPRYISGRL
jgi:hypothetical protein